MANAVRSERRSGWVGVAAIAALILSRPAGAATFGVPTNLTAAGFTQAGSANPQAWFLLQGTDSPAADGDVVYQIRVFIEVPGTTLDIRVYDPGTSDARDIEGDDGLTTVYELRNPCTPFPTCNGTLIQSFSIGNDDNAGGDATQDRLVRFSTTGDWTAANQGSGFTGLTAGLYELRVRANDTSNEVNAFGLDIRDGSGNPLNAFTIGRTAAAASSLLYGAINGGAPVAATTGLATFHPFVDRGCVIQTSNFDMDSYAGGPGTGASGSIVDVLGTSTTLTMSADGDNNPAAPHEEDTITVEPSTGINQESTNYGMYTVTNNFGLQGGNQQNVIDWRVADYLDWSNDPNQAPRNPNGPIRMYLPNRNAYTGNTLSVPSEPVLRTSLQYLSGPNPPSTSGTTRFYVYAHLDNIIATGVPSTTLTGATVTVNVPSPATIVTASGLSAFIEGVAASCSSQTLTASLASCTFADAVPANQTATIRFEVSLAPPAAGTYALTTAPSSGSPVTATFTSGYNATTTAGPVCDLRVNTTTALTRAAVRGVRVERAGVVEFTTLMQKDTAGFDVYAANDPRGRDRVRVTASPVQAPMPNTLLPTLYRAETAPIATRYVMIEEIERGGNRNLLGPFPVGDARLRAAVERVEHALARSAVTERGQARVVRPPSRRERSVRQRSVRVSSRRPHGAPGGGDEVDERPRFENAGNDGPSPFVTQGVRIEVEGTGRVSVAWSELVEQGLPARTRPDRLQLSAQGQAVPFQVVAGATGSPEALVFDAVALDSAYTSRNAYLLTRGPVAPPAAPVTRWADARLEGFRRVERDAFFVPSAPLGGDPWLWDLLFGDGSLWPYADFDPDAGDFDLPGLPEGLSGDVPVRIRLSGYSAHAHSVEAWLNGAYVGRVTFVGDARGMIEGQVPAASLAEAGNRLQLSYSASSADPGDVGFAYLDYLELGVPELPVALMPASVAAFDARLPELSKRTDYLIVSHPDFLEQAGRIAQLKAAEGLRAVVVDVERAYDAFSGGVVEAAAVRALVRAAAQGGLRYVLLLGDDSFDHSDRLGLGAASFVPSLYAWDGQFGRVPSENLYADVNGDGVPDVAIGRLPAQTPEHAEAFVQKIARQREVLRQQAGRHVFALDNPSAGVAFRPGAEGVAAALPPGSQVVWADVAAGLGSARAALSGALGSGVQVAHYFGHGGPEMWADESLFSVDDVAELGNGESVVLSWACQSQWFQYPLGDSVGEALLRRPQGGALASFGPAGITDLEEQPLLYNQVYARLFKPKMTLGEAIRQAKAATLAHPRGRSVVEGFNLLGDPALPMGDGR